MGTVNGSVLRAREFDFVPSACQNTVAGYWTSVIRKLSSMELHHLLGFAS